MPPGMAGQKGKGDKLNSSVSSVNLSDAIDRAPLKALQYGVFLLCLLLLLADGFDAQALGYVVPVMAHQWGIKPAMFAPAFSAGLVGMAIGALALGAFADYAGRRKIIVLCTVVVGAVTFAMGAVTDMTQLMVLRFVAGLGLGGLMPNALALAAEYCPTRARSTVVMIASCGISLGSALGGIVAGMVLHAQGWQAVFHFGGLMSLALTVITLVALPESIRYRALREGRSPSLDRLIRRICPDLQLGADTRIAINEEKPSGITIGQLFTQGRTRQTLLLWTIYFMCLLEIYVFASWLPTVLIRGGVGLRTSVFATSALQIAGTIAALTLGGLLERRNPGRIVAWLYLIGVVGIVGIAMTVSTPWMLVLATACAGFGIVGAQAGTHAIASRSYPTFMRSTGMGWALGIGRIGSVIGPLIGGALLVMNWSTSNLLLVTTIPPLFAACAAWAMAPRVEGDAAARELPEGGSQTAVRFE